MTISLLFCFISVGVLGVCIILILIQYYRLKMQCSIMQDSLTNLEKLNYELRTARHDYLNHLQVVYGLVELEEYQELKEYIKPVYKDMLKTGKDIIMVEQIDGVTLITTVDDTFQTSLSLGSIEEKLGSEEFMRCHKSYIINLSMISKIEVYGRWTYTVKLKNTSKTALMTAQKYEEVKLLYV